MGYEKYVAPAGYSDSYDHFKNFFASVRSRKPVVEDAVFGYPRGRSGAAEQSEHRARRSGALGSGCDEGAVVGGRPVKFVAFPPKPQKRGLDGAPTVCVRLTFFADLESWNDKRIGVHLGTAGGASNAVERAQEIGANTLQIFSSSPRMWRAPKIDPAAGRADAGAAGEVDVGPLVIHTSYLVNVCSQTRDVARRALRRFAERLSVR